MSITGIPEAATSSSVQMLVCSRSSVSPAGPVVAGDVNYTCPGEGTSGGGGGGRGGGGRRSSVRPAGPGGGGDVNYPCPGGGKSGGGGGGRSVGRLAGASAAGAFLRPRRERTNRVMPAMARRRPKPARSLYASPS